MLEKRVGLLDRYTTYEEIYTCRYTSEGIAKSGRRRIC